MNDYVALDVAKAMVHRLDGMEKEALQMMIRHYEKKIEEKKSSAA